jgi:hypothetical protein
MVFFLSKALISVVSVIVAFLGIKAIHHRAILDKVTDPSD